MFFVIMVETLWDTRVLWLYFLSHGVALLCRIFYYEIIKEMYIWLAYCLEIVQKFVHLVMSCDTKVGYSRGS